MIQPLLSQPAHRGQRLVFVTEDDLWAVDLPSGVARRLTSGFTRVRRPVLSHNGQTVVFTAAEEGVADLYAMDADGGPVRRLTWLGGAPIAHTFTTDDHSLLFSHGKQQAFERPAALHKVAVGGGVPVRLPWGHAEGFAFGPDGAMALITHVDDLAHWKRYRGGRVGRLWVDDNGSGTFQRLPSLGGNLANPMWVQLQDERRILFASDHEGSANLYSVRPNGSDAIAHTHHTERSVRFPSIDGTVVIYEHAGSLWRIDLTNGAPEKLAIVVRGQQRHTQQRHPSASKHLEGAALHPEGHSLLLMLRGKPFVGGHWEGPMLQLGVRDGVRHRLARFDHDGTHALWLSDAGGEEHLELCDLSDLRSLPLEIDGEHGRILGIYPSPDGRIALVDDRNRVGILTLDAKDSDGLVRSAQLVWLTEGRPAEPPHGLVWSPDGRWLVFVEPIPRSRTRLRLADLADSSAPLLTDLTDGRFHDRSPDFDPSGRYLVFISRREFDPVPDQVYFGYSFPKGSKPYLITLQATTPSPFDPPPRALGKQKAPKAPATFTIDLDGISDRVVPFPLAESRYSHIRCLPSGRFLLQKQGIRGSAGAARRRTGPPPAHSQLQLWDPDTRELSIVIRAMSGFTMDAHRKTLAVQIGARLRVIPADPDKATRTSLGKNEPWRASRKTFWIDLNRARLSIDPRAEWRQMFLEAWRLQRDNFFDPDHAGVDWDRIRERYLPEVERVATRAELSDLIGCMHGELATSHAYIMGGDHPTHVVRTVGRLAADFSWDGASWVVDTVHRGEVGDPKRSCPLLAPGVNAGVGTRILAVDGRAVVEHRPLESFLVGHAGRPVRFTIQRPDGEGAVVWVRPLSTDTPARYRTWVHRNRSAVHAATEGRVGYVHVPDMGPGGFADFHRDYLAESERGGLIVDVRYNRGGHVSQLLLGRLMQRRLAYTQSRHFGIHPYPAHSVGGPMVALTNANAGSDGDIFSHNWKQLALGPLIGERTWGGVVGIRPRYRLTDDTLTTQPEFAFWMGPKAGFGVEGYGVDPDIEVVHTPMDWATGTDPQLERALVEINALLVGYPEEPPALGPFLKR